MKKRLLSTLLALCMALALVPGTALAAEEEEEEWSYTYPVTGGNIYLEYGFDKESGYVYHVYDCDESVTEAVIPSQVDGHTITCIGEDAFEDCTNLISVILPDSITDICYSAFSGCTALVNVEIPASVTYIGVGVFLGCTSLTNIAIAKENTEYMAENSTLFSKDKTSLICCPAASGSYNVPEGVVHIEQTAFSGCTGLESVSFPSTLTEIWGSAFRNCTNLKNINFSDSITGISRYAFAGCTALTSVVLPSSLKNLDGYAFSQCTGLTNLTIPASITSMGGNVIGTAPASVKFNPFFECDNLTDIYYAGSEEQWESIYPAEMTATIHYNSTGPDTSEPDTPEPPSGSAFTFEFEFGGLDPQTGDLKMSIVVYMNGIELLTIPLTLHLG